VFGGKFQVLIDHSATVENWCTVWGCWTE